MAAQQDRGRAEDAIFIADILLAQNKAKEAKGTATSATGSKFNVRWVEKDVEGRPLLKRNRSGETRKRASTTVVSVVSSEDATPFEEVPTVTQSNCSQQLFESEMQKLQNILTSADVQGPNNNPSTSTSWCLRQSVAQDEWRKARSYHINCLLSCNVVPEGSCSYCSSPAIIRCRDCMPQEWLCMDCDIHIHKKLTLHNRESCIEGIYKPIEPAVCCVKKDGRYTLVSQVCLLPTVRPVNLCSCDPANITESAGRAVILVCINGRYDLHMPNLQCRLCLAHWTPDMSDLIQSGYWPASVNADTLFSVDVFGTFEEMKTVAPSLSRQGFLRMLERRTCHFGRAGKIHGDVFQRSYMEYTFCQYQCEKMASVEHFTCPACTPSMLALCADGNRKLYRFRQSKGSEKPYFDGTFIAKDTDVHHFVDEIRSKMKSTAGRGLCGASQWSAARETARRASKLDEEGLEVVVCRHGMLLRALNMYRGEIFAYPLYLQKELQAATNGQFYCMDIACKYWPYIEKLAVSMLDLRPLLQMRPFLSVMHAKAHSTKCEIIWSGKNQEGAGTTAGEEVEMVNSYLSRCALTTKYMTKSARNDMLTVHAIGWNRQKKKCLHLALSSRRFLLLLEDLSSELGCPENIVHQWVHDVRQWATDGTRCDDDQSNLQKSIEQMFLGVHQKKASLYNQTDSNKIRHLRRRRLWEEKRKLFDTIKLYNEQVPDEERIVEEKVVSGLSVAGGDREAESVIWPWEVHSSESSNILTKKKIFDAYMSKVRHEEEKIIVMREMRQHCTYLKRMADNIRTVISEISSGRNRCLNEEGHRGLLCLLQKRLADVEEKFQVVCSSYRQALGPNASSLLEDGPEEMLEDHEEVDYESSDDSDFEGV
ncbi:hypothetical protein Q8A67_005686 [Cirrhinus molitorella]|uniref:CxC3 like cysteine cluster domain-containing protein n=1 Tax=Cirrhinus molitorella TaxID=172907 RepID=A0AA88U2D8_9TELE|nr:hypothetical protein Q8A67_005686 [Cirrhinus molitorella]